MPGGASLYNILENRGSSGQVQGELRLAVRRTRRCRAHAPLLAREKMLLYQESKPMPKFDLILYPANLLQPGDVIVTGSLHNPSHLTVSQVKRLTVCYEIICEPYRRFVVRP